VHQVGGVFFSPLQSIAKNDRAPLCRQLLTRIFRRACFSLLSPACVLFAAFCSWRTLACFFIPWSDICSIPYFEQLFRRDEISWQKSCKKVLSVYLIAVTLVVLLCSIALPFHHGRRQADCPACKDFLRYLEVVHRSCPFRSATRRCNPEWPH